MANMLRANQAARAIYKPKGPVVYGECNCCLLASVNATDSVRLLLLAVPSVAYNFSNVNFVIVIRMSIVGCMSTIINFHQHQHNNMLILFRITVTQRNVKTEESSNTKYVNHLGRINAQMFDSSGVSIVVTESIMARATQKWVHSNKKDGGNKRKKLWDELVVEEYEKEQPYILTHRN
ncbi:hypothetical protein MTR67_022767 [Solanum verrucosum]|uniref:Uncharacterized protein n=1 Tax=Solanum verrucosum TaxID=315347 RepID=A0AAF0QSC7_SOLVR|nr:hypothetical protein MTR67_022767 [Solanum verrucosum]